MTRNHDVIVVGAGMVGACTALALARSGLSVAVIERQPLSRMQWQLSDDIDLRVSALSPASQQLLARLGVWSEIRNQRCCEYHHMRVWHENGSTEMHFSAEQNGAPILGSIVENGLVQSTLIQQLELLDNVTLLFDQSVQQLEQSNDDITLVTSAQTPLNAQLLIAADGRQSSVRERLHLPVLGGSYRQTAIVANIDTELDHQHTAWQRFLHTGPVALLPLANGKSSIVWSADTERAKELLQLSEADFRQQLGEATELRLGAVTGVSQRAGFPLSWHAAHRWSQGRVLFIGDAAHGVHPLAGQGVNLGFGDVALLQTLMRQEDAAFQPRLLRRFERQRKAETTTATHLFSALKEVYASRNPLLCLARDLGMRMVDRNPLIKRRVIRSAMRNMG